MFAFFILFQRVIFLVDMTNLSRVKISDTLSGTKTFFVFNIIVIPCLKNDVT